MSTLYKIPSIIKQEEKIAVVTYSAIESKTYKLSYTNKVKKIYETWKNDGKPTAKLDKIDNVAIVNKKTKRYLVCVRNTFGNIGDDITLHLKDSTKIKCRIASHISQNIINIKSATTLKKYVGIDPIKKNITSEKDIGLFDGKQFVCLFITSKNLGLFESGKLSPIVSVENEIVTKQDTQKTSKLQEEKRRVSELAITKKNMFQPSTGETSPKPTDKWYSSPGNSFPYNSLSGGNCTWYAYGRFCEIAKKWVECSFNGNAVHFYDKSYFPTCKRGKTPKLGAIACWGKGSELGEEGHVAVVEKLYSNGDIAVTESGYTGGWHKGLHKLKKEHNYCDGWTASGYVFRGFIYNPIEFDEIGTVIGVDNGDIQLDMRQRISKLYTSNNYSYLKELAGSKTKESPIQPLINLLKNEVSKRVKDEPLVFNLKNHFKESIYTLKTIEISEAGKLNRKVNSKFDITKSLVETPVVVVQIGDIVIGSKEGNSDKYPNYISGLAVTRTNGEINNYKLSIVHQIRVGDDPLLFDKLLSTNNFKKITISYGDCESGTMFENINAIITNVTMNRDYSSSKITYGIEAMSAGHYITANKINFPANDDKPSNVIRQLLYNSIYSNELKKAFPAMASKTEVESKGWIPTNDKVVHLNAKPNTDIITYFNYLVSSMSNETNNDKKALNDSSYFIFYTDNKENGAGFEIKEIKKSEASNKFNSVYEANIGYPDENNIFDFQVTTDKSWAILYEKTIAASNAEEYIYTIEDNGDIEKYYTPNIVSSSNVMTEREKNLWSFMTGFPVTATLTMRGLLRPSFLTNYIKINVVFYGVKHITSGLYTIVEQVDTLSGNGFRTTLSLIRVGEE